MNQHPFFSLVVPCYNDGRYKAGQYLDRLLTSVVQSGLNYDDIEVILADDQSIKSYGRTISKFSNYFVIKQCTTHQHYGHPGPVRNWGVQCAAGEWLCFADHDDMFYPRALHTVKDIIEASKNSPVYVHADFDKVSNEDPNQIIETFKNESNNAPMFIHGKFYNRERLWVAYQLHFPETLTSHEDLALGIQVKCALRKQGDDASLHIPTSIYMWVNNPNSISNTCYKDTKEHSFLEVSYKNYLTSTIGQYLDGYKRNRISNTDLIAQVIPLLLNCWFQIGTFKINNPDSYIKENVNYVAEVWHDLKKSLKLSSPALKVMMKQISGRVIDSINETASNYNLLDFDSWIAELDKEEE